MKYFFDTYAIIEIIGENKKYDKFKEEEIATSIMNIGEVYYIVLRQKDEEVADYWYKILKQSAFLVDIETIVKAMKFRFENKTKKFSFVDCLGYIIAKDKSLRFLTGDKAFENFDNVEFVK